jgi:hypothetical protein
VVGGNVACWEEWGKIEQNFVMEHFLVGTIWLDAQYIMPGRIDLPGDDKGEGPSITEGSRNIGSQQTAFDTELAAIEQAISWFQGAERVRRHMTVHSDSTSAIARAGRTGRAQARRPHATSIWSATCELAAELSIWYGLRATRAHQAMRRPMFSPDGQLRGRDIPRLCQLPT